MKFKFIKDLYIIKAKYHIKHIVLDFSCHKAEIVMEIMSNDKKRSIDNVETTMKSISDDKKRSKTIMIKLENIPGKYIVKTVVKPQKNNLNSRATTTKYFSDGSVEVFNSKSVGLQEKQDTIWHIERKKGIRLLKDLKKKFNI